MSVGRNYGLDIECGPSMKISAKAKNFRVNEK